MRKHLAGCQAHGENSVNLLIYLNALTSWALFYFFLIYQISSSVSCTILNTACLKLIFYIPTPTPPSSHPKATTALSPSPLFHARGPLQRSYGKTLTLQALESYCPGLNFCSTTYRHVTLDKILNVSKSQFLQLRTRYASNLSYGTGKI